MKRILANTCGDEHSDLSFALIVMDPDTARWWLEQVKPDVDALSAKFSTKNYSGRFYALEIWDWQPDFIRLDHEEDLTEELVEEIEQSEFIYLPDEIVLASADEARMDFIIGIADVSGVFWRGREKYGPWEVETPIISWEMMADIADQTSPLDNSGRKHCWWCGKRTEEVELFTSTKSECPDCKK